MDVNNFKQNNKFNISSLTNNELLAFSNIHRKIIPKRNKKINIKVIKKNSSISNFFNNDFLNNKKFNGKYLLNIDKKNKYYELKNLISTNLNINIEKPIIDKVLSILKENNIYNIDPTNYYIEFHQLNCGFEKKKYQSLDWHYDDYGAVNYKVYTVIFYLRKDKTVKGGNLEYKLNKKIKIHNVKSGDIAQFTGDIYHKPQPTYGFGCRDIIVVFIKKIN